MAITNQRISKVYKGKSGDGQYGPWQIWDVYFEGDETKYAYFEGKDKFVPKKGTVVLYADVEERVKGEYTNYTLKDVKFDQKGTQDSQKGGQDQRSIEGGYDDVVWKHGPCIIELMKLSRSTGEKLSALIDEMKSGAHYVAKSKGLTVAKIAQNEPPAWEEPPIEEPINIPDDIDDSMIPF